MTGISKSQEDIRAREYHKTTHFIKPVHMVPRIPKTPSIGKMMNNTTQNKKKSYSRVL